MTTTHPKVTVAELWAAVRNLATAQAAMAAADRDATGLLTQVLRDQAPGNPAASVADVMAALPAPEREAFGELYDEIHGLMDTARVRQDAP